jgi:hypothetical protein
MSNIVALERKTARLLDQADSRRKPKTLVFVLEQRGQTNQGPASKHWTL